MSCLVFSAWHNSAAAARWQHRLFCRLKNCWVRRASIQLCYCIRFIVYMHARASESSYMCIPLSLKPNHPLSTSLYLAMSLFWNHMHGCVPAIIISTDSSYKCLKSLQPSPHKCACHRPWKEVALYIYARNQFNLIIVHMITIIIGTESSYIRLSLPLQPDHSIYGCSYQFNRFVVYGCHNRCKQIIVWMAPNVTVVFALT